MRRLRLRFGMEDAPPEILEEHKLTCDDVEYTVLQVKMTPEQAAIVREILEQLHRGEEE